MNLKPTRALFLCLLLFGAKAQADITSGLVVHLKLNETTGNAAADSSGNNNNGNYSGDLGDNSQWTTGRIGGAARFNADGSNDDVITVPDPGTLNFGASGTFTLSAWVKGALPSFQTNSGGILAKGAGGGGEQFAIDIQNSTYRFFVRGGATNTAYPVNTTVSPDGTWQHLVAVMNGPQGFIKFYINNQLVGTNVVQATALDSTHDLSIGSRELSAVSGYNLPFTGLVDDVRVYSRAFSDAEVNELYADAGVVGPVIVQPPLSLTRFLTEEVTLSVVVDGTVPLGYQWKQNGNDLTGATRSSLTLTNLQVANGGSYTVGVTNAAGGVLSAAGVLTINTNTPGLTNGLIAHWKFDETTGLTAADSFGTNTASLLNFDGDDTQWVPGRIGGALRLNPPGDTVHDDLVETDGNVLFNDQDNFTFSIWVRLTDIDNGANPRLISPTVTHWMIWSKAAGGVGLFSSRPSPVPEVLLWKQFTMTYNRASSTYALYVNGVKSGTNATGFAKTAPGAVRWIIAHSEAATGHGEYLRADIDDVRIYNRIMSDADVLALYKDAGNYFKIGKQPVGATKVERDAITMSIVADGNLPITYQWQKNGTNLAGATRSTLSLSSLTLASAGDYRVALTSGNSNLLSDVAVLIVQPAPAAALNNGLIAQWTFDETSGTTAADASGNGNSATLYNYAEGNSQWRPGIIGGALMFNEGAARTNFVGTDAPLSLQNGDQFTFTFWAKRNPGATGVNPRLITPLGPQHWVLWTPNRGVGFFTTQPSLEPISNSWRHFVVTFDRVQGTYGLIVDGVRQLWDVGGYSRSDPTGLNWIIGHSENATLTSDSFTGLLDDVRVYNRILNMNDVDALYFPVGSPVLKITRTGNNHVLTWARGATGYHVQSATTLLNTGTVWSDVSGTPTIDPDGSTQSLTLPGGTGTLFYRLMKNP